MSGDFTRGFLKSRFPDLIGGDDRDNVDITGGTISGVTIENSTIEGDEPVLFDPRAFGAQATGCYGIAQATVFRAGTGFAVGDEFLAADLQLEAHMRGGVNATGHVTAVDVNGGVLGFVIDTPGSGYFVSALYCTPLTGKGLGFAINVTQINVPPAAPTLTLVSGGGATAALGGAYIPGGYYAVGDTFAIPNPSQNGNYMTGRVSSISTNGAVTGYTINNAGGDYQPATNVAAITLTGYGSGLIFNITSSTSSNNTYDDTYGIINAAIASNIVGGAVIIPNNCWVANLMVPASTTLVGQAYGVNYGYEATEGGTTLITPSANPHMFIIGTPQFGIDFNGQANIALVNFQVRGYTGNGFQNSTTWDSTAAIGSKYGSGSGAKCWLYGMSARSCYAGLGSPDGTGSFLFIVSQNSDYSANQNGIYGPFSDFLSFGDTITSVTNGINMPATSGGLCRIMFPRIEYVNNAALQFNGFGSLQPELVGVQCDRIVGPAVLVSSTQQVNITGCTFKGCGLAGTLKVTGAAAGTGGVVRLTVTGFGSKPTGGTTATSGLTTGMVCNVSGVGGTTEANGNQFTITVVDGTHIELQGTTFVNTYTSGGNVNVNALGSYIVVSGSTDINITGTGFFGYSAGSLLPAASIIDSTGSSRISIIGGCANPGNVSNASGYTQAFANWHNSGNTPPANFTALVNDALSLGSTQTTVAGSTSGNATFTQPLQGASEKSVNIYLGALTGTATYTFPTPFSFTPQIVTTNGPAASVVTSLSTTSVTVTGSATTGFIKLTGF